MMTPALLNALDITKAAKELCLHQGLRGSRCTLNVGHPGQCCFQSGFCLEMAANLKFGKAK